ncbi:MAG: 16S rRNA (uracil(1498)-N(3))-methyltransferase [Caulobacteraceae bacterium]|nr:16S rRNA (uracil(1498)-N(3))-methyltransferase [Caulobacteraceae bacterium]
MIRLYVDQPLGAEATVRPDPDQCRYLLGVMRLKTGDELLLFNGRDGEWLARVGEAGKKTCALVLAARTREQSVTPDLDLVVALVKRNRLETIVEKAAELGCRRVRLAITRRTNADHTNVARLQAIATEAAEQTGRLDVPLILEPEKLGAMLDGWDSARFLLFCDEGGHVPTALQALRDADGPWAVLIGPEGGFDDSERSRLHGESFVRACSLGPRILRADTAAIAALTLWQASAGDWRD